MLNDEINALIAKSMKEGNHQKTEVYRAIKNEFLKFRTAKADNELTDKIELQLLDKMMKQRRQSAEEFKAGNREDLAEKESWEASFLEQFLPKEATQEEIETAVTKEIETISADHAVSMKDMRNILGNVQKQYPTVSGGQVSKVLQAYMKK